MADLAPELDLLAHQPIDDGRRDVLPKHAEDAVLLLDRVQRAEELLADLVADDPGHDPAGQQQHHPRAVVDRGAEQRVDGGALGLRQEVGPERRVLGGGHGAGEDAEPDVEPQGRKDDEDEVGPGRRGVDGEGRAGHLRSDQDRDGRDADLDQRAEVADDPGNVPLPT